MTSIQTNQTVAVIDVGSNSIKLLVARKGAKTNRIESVYKKTLETRISKGISQQQPRLTAEAMDSGCRSISELASIARNFAPKTIRIVATSAVRDAINGPEFVQRVNAATGVQIDILSGIEEATYIGKGLNCDPGIAGMKNFVQMDIGGGSLELIRFSEGDIEDVCSLKLGAVRLTEKFLTDRTAPISPETETNIRNHVRESIQTSDFTFKPKAVPLVVTGGAFSILRSILAAQTGRTFEDIAPTIDKRDIMELKTMLCRLGLAERKTIPGLPAVRADVMPTALITIDTVLECAGCDTVTHSSYNLRYGIAADLLETRQGR